MAEVVTIDGLADAITDALTEYTSDIEDAIPDVVKARAKAARDELRVTSPEKTGDYSKGWSVKAQPPRSGGVAYVVHNVTDYQLTHLLENGHAIRTGGRVAAIPHIAPVANGQEAKLMKDIQLLISSRG